MNYSWAKTVYHAIYPLIPILKWDLHGKYLILRSQMIVIQNSSMFYVPCSNKQRACVHTSQIACQGDPETPLSAFRKSDHLRRRLCVFRGTLTSICAYKRVACSYVIHWFRNSIIKFFSDKIRPFCGLGILLGHLSFDKLLFAFYHFNTSSWKEKSW